MIPKPTHRWLSCVTWRRPSSNASTCPARSPPHARLKTQDTSPLTARENEVAALVAQSLSNREIATRLFLSERTIESHIRNILAKLSFTRRTEIVTWVGLRQP